MYNDQGGIATLLASFERGHTVESLCRTCNNGASERKLPQAYGQWRTDVIGHLKTAGVALNDTTGAPADDLWGLHTEDGALFLPLEHGSGQPGKFANLHPGRIARQLLGMVLAVQENLTLLDGSPELAAAYFSEEPTSIEPYTLHVALANAGLAYFTGALAALSIDPTSINPTDVADCVGILSLPPFLIMLVNGNTAPTASTRIDHWFNFSTAQTFSKSERTVSFPIADQRDLLVNLLYTSVGGLPVDKA